jgi:hypothetical protein
MTNFQAFWLGLNIARKELGLSEILYGEARLLWQAAQETHAKIAA